MLLITSFSVFQKINSSAATPLQPGPSNVESNNSDALRTKSDNVLTTDDLLGFQWQIACGMVTLKKIHRNDHTFFGLIKNYPEPLNSMLLKDKSSVQLK